MVLVRVLVWVRVLVLALVQEYGKRLLGYSSIAHVGYMLMAFGLGLVYERPAIVSAGLFLVVAHAAMKGLAFLCKGVCHFYYNATTIEELRGIGPRIPATASCFVLALASLMGVPPLAGFMGKWQTLISVSENVDMAIGVAVGAFILNSLLGLGYYLRLIGLIITQDDSGKRPVHVSYWMLVPLIALAGLVVCIGVFPQPVLRLTDEAAQFLLRWGH